MTWPNGRAFAFTIFDDTDLATVANVGGVYSFLEDIGLRTTKSVWPVTGTGTPRIAGATCDDEAYAEWTIGLQSRGFEIGYHGASNVTAPRDLSERAIKRFKSLYGHPPATMANHADCREGIYWGPDRVSGVNRHIYNVLTRYKNVGRYRGHVEGDELFWGDICRANVRYVRNFTFANIDTLQECPEMPYQDQDRPYVHAWFAASEGRDVAAFNRLVSEDNQDRLEAQGGACIVYTHLAAGFIKDGRLDPEFERLMRRLASRNGWFVPVSTLLDHLAAGRETLVIDRKSRAALERRWLMSKVRTGSS